MLEGNQWQLEGDIKGGEGVVPGNKKKKDKEAGCLNTALHPPTHIRLQGK